MNAISLLDLAAKSAGFLLLGFALQTLWRRASAAQRGLVWLSVFTSLLLLPAGLLLRPAITMVPPAFVSPGNSGGAVPISQSTEAGMTAHAAPPAERLSPLQWTALVWAAGAGLLLARRGLGSVQLAGLKSRSRRVADGRVLDTVARLTAEAGVARTINVREADRVTVPLTWGLLRPVLLLPSGAENWSAPQLEAALRHELGHIRHLDAATRWLMTLGCALHWPNPLVWLAAKSWRTAQEQASDDLVVAAGAPAEDYALQLLDAARAVQTSGFQQPPAAALAMARPSTLESRLTALLDPTRNRHPLRRKALALGTAAALLFSALCATLQLRAADPPATAMDRAAKIIVPKIDFSNANLPEVVEYVQAKGRELDPSKKGVNLILDAALKKQPKPLQISLSLRDVPLSVLIGVISDLAGAEAVAQNDAIFIQPKGSAPAKSSAPGTSAAEKKAAAIILPALHFEQASAEVVVGFLRQTSSQYDTSTGTKGVNFILKLGSGELPKVTLNLKNVSVLDATKIIAKQAGLVLTANEQSLILEKPAK